MIRIRNVTHEYTTADGNLLALDRVSLDISSGQFVSLIGASGCGKTTLLRNLAGLETHSSGEISLFGAAPKLGRDDIAFVFQQDSLWPWRTVERAVAFPLEMRDVPKAERRRRVREALDMVGLAEFAKAYPHQLSGGMRQRVNLCRALVCNPRVMLMDEPFGALDAQTREYMQEQLWSVSGLHDRTSVFVTHDISEAVYLSDEVVVLSSRPGTVKATIPIPWGSDRDLDVKRSPEFQTIVDEIWHMIADDVKSAMTDSQIKKTSDDDTPTVGAAGVKREEMINEAYGLI